MNRQTLPIFWLLQVELECVWGIDRKSVSYVTHGQRADPPFEMFRLESEVIYKEEEQMNQVTFIVS